MIETRPEPAKETAILRPGGERDLDHVMRVMTAAFPPTFGEAWTRSQCAGILPMSGVSLTVAEVGGHCVGFSLMRAVADESELLLIGVEPNAQRQGVGAALVTHFITKSRTAGAHRFHLEVREGNPAVTLYQVAGFSPAGRRRDYYRGPNGDRHDALTLALSD